MAETQHQKHAEDVESSTNINDDTQEEPIPFELTGSKLLFVMIGLTLAIFLMSVDGSIIATAIPRITSQFGSTDDIGWYGSAYFFATCAMQPMAGKLFANFSMKTTFLASLAVFEIGSVLCATAVNSPMLIVGRAIAGVAGAGVSTGAFSIIASSLPLHKRGAYIGICHATFGIATILGPVIGGALTEHASWRWCFYINLPIGAVTVCFLVLFFHPPPRNDDKAKLSQKLAKLDFIGLGLFMPSILMILLALQWGGTEYPWKSATIIGLFLGGAGLTTIFLLWQLHKRDNAMIPPRLITQHTMFVACFINFFAMGAVLVSIYYLPEWFQVIKAVSPTKSGIMYLPLSISDILSSISAGVLVSQIGYANPFVLAGPALMSIGTGLMSTFTPTTNHQHWIPYQVLQGLGAGMTLSMPYVATQTVLLGDDIPVGTSILQLFQFLGGSVFLAIAQSIFTNELTTSLAEAGIGRTGVEKILHAGAAAVRQVVSKDELPEVVNAYNHGITSTFYVAAAAAAVSCIIACGLEWRSVKQTPQKAKEKEARVEKARSEEEKVDNV